MDNAKRKAMELAGWTFGDAADFLEMSEEERQLLEMRVSLARAIRDQREASHMSQKQLGNKLKTSQPRVAKIEKAASDVSLDQLVKAFAAAGGKIEVQSSSKKSGLKKKASVKSGGVVLKVTTSR